MKNPRNFLLPALAITASFSAVTVQADTNLGADNFSLSSGTNVSPVTDTEAAGVGTYSAIQIPVGPPAGTPGMTVTTASGFGSGNVLSLSNSTNTYYRAFNAAPFSLNSLAVNDKLTMSFNVRVDGGTFAAAQNFSFGFVNTTSANSIVYANVDLNGGSSELRYRTGSFNMSDAGPTLGTSWIEPTTVSTSSHLFVLTVTRVSTGFTVNYTRDGNSLKNETFTSASVWATALAGVNMTGIAFRHSQTPGVITYLDNVNVSIAPESPSASYASWIGNYSLGGLTAVSDDPDNDGLANGLEFVLKDGNPQVPNTTPFPSSSTDANNLVFSFERDDRAKGTGSGVIVTVEAGTDLTNWPDVYQVKADTALSTSGVVITNDANANPDTITVTIPKSGAPAKFARLKVVGAP